MRNEKYGKLAYEAFAKSAYDNALRDKIPLNNWPAWSLLTERAKDSWCIAAEAVLNEIQI